MPIMMIEQVKFNNFGKGCQALGYTFRKISDFLAVDDLWHPCSRIAEKSGFRSSGGLES